MKIFATVLLLSFASLLGAENGEGIFIQFELELAEPAENQLQVADQVADRMALTLQNEGISEFLFASDSETISLVLPTLGDREPNQLAELLTAKNLSKPLLNFHRVHPQNHTLSGRVAEGTADLPEGYHLSEDPVTDSDGERIEGKSRPILIEDEPIVTGDKVEKAWADSKRPGYIFVRLTEEGGREMKAFTAEIMPGRDRLANIFNGEVLSAPGFQTKNLGKRFVIIGGPRTVTGTEFLASNFNPLPSLAVSLKSIRMIAAENLANPE